MECGDNYFTPEENIAISSDEVSGIDFLFISDSNAHSGLDCYMISIDADAVFNEIIVNGVNVVTAKGLSGKTVHAGSMLPFGKAHATSIDLTSGQVFAYIY